MPILYRPIRPSRLTEVQLETKLKRDAEYKADSDARASAFYSKKKTTGVTPEEEAVFRAGDIAKWEEYRLWAISEGLYEEVTLEQQLTEAEAILESAIEKVNEVRAELSLSSIKVI